MSNESLNAQDKAAIEEGLKFGIDMLMQVPKSDQRATEAHITGVLITFMGALWGTFGTEYARGFIEAQLRGMEPGQPHQQFTQPRVQ